MPHDEPIVVTGIGMRSPVGSNTVQSCASVRAGLNRFTEWPYFVAESDEESLGLVASATVPDLGDAPWVHKVERLVAEPIYEMIWHAELFNLVGGSARREPLRTGAFLAVPNADRADVDAESYQRFLVDASQHCISPIPETPLTVVPSDHTGGVVALASAMSHLQAGAVDVCFVGGVDSYLSSAFLGWLSDNQRLKGKQQSSGIIPGEGACFLALEREVDARNRGAKIQARVASIAIDKEPAPTGPDHPVGGDALSRAIRGVVAAIGGAGQLHRIISDLNGERWRFLEWAVVESRCFGDFPQGWRHWHPADCLGDIGAAFGTTAVGIAARAFARGYGGDGGILICSSADSGERAACCVFPS